MVYYVYFLIDPITGKPFYVGKGCKKRMYEHVNNAQRDRIPNGSNIELRNKIKKILSERNVKYKKVFETDNETKAYNKEKELIAEIGLENLCNLTSGGEGGGIPNDETRRKISEAQIGKKNHRYGKKLSKETKKKMSESLRSENHPMFGKHHTSETKIKMSKALSCENNPMFGRIHSNEARLKISNSQKGKRNSQYGTCWITKDGLNKKIKKDDLSMFTKQNWLKGRKI